MIAWFIRTIRLKSEKSETTQITIFMHFLEMSETVSYRVKKKLSSKVFSFTTQCSAFLRPFLVRSIQHVDSTVVSSIRKSLRH